MAIRARTLLSWALVLVLVIGIGFFGYHILDVSTQGMVLSLPGALGIQMSGFPGFLQDSQKVHMQRQEQEQEQGQGQGQAQGVGATLPSIQRLLQTAPAEDGTYEEGEHPGPVVYRGPPIPNEMPRVPGQTEEDLRAPEPLQATPPSVQYMSPEATDPMNRTAHMNAEFGNNFRHPEQMIEMRPPSSMQTAMDSHLASERSGPGGHNASGFTPEMAQNGGEFMRGIGAFDTSEIGTGFSMI